MTSYTAAGTVITYTYTVTNDGTVPLHNVTVVDSKIGTVLCPRTTLAVDASMVCTARYTTTAADVTAHEVANTATASAFSPNETLTTGSASLVIPTPTVPPVPPTPSVPPVPPTPTVPPPPAVPSVRVVPAVPVTG